MLELVYTSRTNPAPWASVSDRDLLLAIRADDEGAFKELIGRKTKPLLQLAQRILGEVEETRDVVQVTFFKVWENRRKFDTRWSPNTWLYRITSNLAIDYLRSRRCREKGDEPFRAHLLQVAEIQQNDDLSRLELCEIEAVFREIASELTDKQRVAFLLKELEGLSSQEVAEIMNCRLPTVRNHVYNARRHLRRELMRRYPEYGSSFGFHGDEEEVL
jgi:RNA polymerase sigma-70 factor, ECF subfamily